MLHRYNTKTATITALSMLVLSLLVVCTSIAQHRKTPDATPRVHFASDSESYVDVTTEPHLLEPIVPIYPKKAKQRKLQGSVMFTFFVTKNGKIEKIKEKHTTDRMFVSAARGALAKAHYAPAIGPNGNPLGVWWTETVRFRLKDTVTSVVRLRMTNLDSRDEFIPSPFVSADPFIGSQGSDSISYPTMRYSIDDVIVYPEVAKRNRLQGEVHVSALINEHGIVEATKVVSSSDTIFDAAAQSGIERMLFTPVVKDGKPIKKWWTIPVVFHYDRKKGE